MAYFSYFLIFIIGIFGSNYVEGAEFVPVFMWGTNKMSEHVPALHKISQDSFKDTILEYLKKYQDPYFIVFAERTLSPEDFAQRDQKGESAFANIQHLKNEGNFVSYIPYVQNPIGAVKQVNKPITQISITSILSSVNVPKENIWIINLDDAKDDETRFHMLKRHDFDVTSIYKDIQKQHENVLVMYTANHTAWVAPEDVTHIKPRNLLQVQDTKADPVYILFNKTGTLLYLTSPGTFQNLQTKNQVNITSDFEFNTDTDSTGNNVTATLSKGSVNIAFQLVRKVGYWYLTSLTVNDGTSEESLHGTANMFAPVGFSYHCGEFNLTDKNKKVSLHLPGFQIQSYTNNSGFNDAYDCVGFTSVPIWSGLFVTAIMLLIITFGLTMMMDIRTMDRFDDPKGKTIAITASE